MGKLTRVESQMSITDIKSYWRTKLNQGYSVSRMVVVNHISLILVVSRMVSLPNRLPASLAFGDPDYVPVSTLEADGSSWGANTTSAISDRPLLRAATN